MPVLETDFLKGIIDPQDRLHPASVKALEEVEKKRWFIASSALLELDLLLKNSGISAGDRVAAFQALKSEIPRGRILPILHQTLSEAAILQREYSRIGRFYFDSIHLAIAIGFDGEIVSSDKTFDQVGRIKRVPLEEL